jgi:ketosteroid isomerase-like protein
MPKPARSSLCVLVLSVVLLLGLGAAVPGQGKRDATLDKLTLEFAAAYSARDAARVASFYADRAVVMAPDMPMVRGREAIEAYYKHGFAQSSGTLRLQPLESAITGATAYEAGTSTLVATRGDESAGKYVVIYERIRNEWKIVYDIFNNDPPVGR